MYLLDSDTASLAFRNHPQVSARILTTPPRQIWLSSIAAEETLQGALGSINYARSRGADQEAPARFLISLVANLADFRMLAYDNAADRLFRSWPPGVRRIGPNDCRIAASAIVHGLIVVTCNGKDFGRIPGVQVEDWSVASLSR